MVRETLLESYCAERPEGCCNLHAGGGHNCADAFCCLGRRWYDSWTHMRIAPHCSVADRPTARAPRYVRTDTANNAYSSKTYVVTSPEEAPGSHGPPGKNIMGVALSYRLPI